MTAEQQLRPRGASFGKPDRSGRSSGKLDRAERKLLGPPQGQAWSWLTTELLASDAWRGMSLACRRFVDFLQIEHANHAGRENGNLIATYSQLEAVGLKRKKIRSVINEAVERGLVRVTVTGGLHGFEAKRTPTRYRLTWIGTVDPPTAASNEWKAYASQKHFPAYPVGHPIAYPVGHPTEVDGKEIRHSRKRRPPTPWATASISREGGPDQNSAQAERDRLKGAYAAKHGWWPR